MRPIKSIMKVKKEKFDGIDLMLNVNNKQEIIRNPSYSIIHTLEEDFNIMMYSCTHDTKMWNVCVHRKHDVMLI